MASKKETSDKSKISASKEVKQAFVKLAKHNLGQLQHDIDSLSPKDRLNFLLHFYEYILPKLSRTADEIENTTPALRNWVITPVAPRDYEEEL